MCLAVMCDPFPVLWVAEVLGAPKGWTLACNKGPVMFP